jgi:hypothetical protein
MYYHKSRELSEGNHVAAMRALAAWVQKGPGISMWEVRANSRAGQVIVPHLHALLCTPVHPLPSLPLQNLVLISSHYAAGCGVSHSLIGHQVCVPHVNCPRHLEGFDTFCVPPAARQHRRPQPLPARLKSTQCCTTGSPGGHRPAAAGELTCSSFHVVLWWNGTA